MLRGDGFLREAANSQILCHVLSQLSSREIYVPRIQMDMRRWVWAAEGGLLCHSVPSLPWSTNFTPEAFVTGGSQISADSSNKQTAGPDAAQ